MLCVLCFIWYSSFKWVWNKTYVLVLWYQECNIRDCPKFEITVEFHQYYESEFGNVLKFHTLSRTKVIELAIRIIAMASTTWSWIITNISSTSEHNAEFKLKKTSTESWYQVFRHWWHQWVLWWRHEMEKKFRVTGPLCEEFTGHPWIPRTKASDAEFWCFLWSTPEKTVE